MNYATEARRLVSMSSGVDIDIDDLYVVWFCKTLQNRKALVSTDAVDNTYWEVTHNGDKSETYIDTYKKERNERVVY